MNYLAHIYLARHDNAAMLGALLGDFAKANVAGKYAPLIETEILLHRKIDSYTDSHAVTKAALQRFAPGRRRFAGIVLDVFYDHLLAKDWPSYSDVPLQEFVQNFYRTLDTHHHLLPPKLLDIAPRMAEQNWLGSYQDFRSVEFAVNRISQRLSRDGNLLREALLDLEAHHTALTAGFAHFFPELMQFAEAERNRLRQKNTG
ncbi:MAG: DUF479 domain-containing protein [Proteobacteria bacterium]|nr:DUF479 domain-containing protein [Pseudomonadota bacterium]